MTTAAINPVWHIIDHASAAATDAAWYAFTDALVEPTDLELRQRARELGAIANKANDLLARTPRYL